VPSAPLLVLGGDIPGLVAVMPASAAAATFAYAMTADLGAVSGIQSAAYAINDNGQRLAGHTARFTPDNATAINENGAQDLPPARLIHAGRSGRPRRAGIVQTI
jgi:hypothetical protein